LKVVLVEAVLDQVRFPWLVAITVPRVASGSATDGSMIRRELPGPALGKLAAHVDSTDEQA
jgi:hypothetical protein